MYSFHWSNYQAFVPNVRRRRVHLPHLTSRHPFPTFSLLSIQPQTALLGELATMLDVVVQRSWASLGVHKKSVQEEGGWVGVLLYL